MQLRIHRQTFREWIRISIPHLTGYVITYPCWNKVVPCYTRRARFLPFDLSGRRGIVVVRVCPSVHPSVRKLYFVHTITRHRFELESPNLHQICILGSSQLVLKTEVIDLEPWAKLAQNWARIITFAPSIHLGILSDGIENGDHWPWLLRSFGHFDSRNGIQRRSCILI